MPGVALATGVSGVIPVRQVLDRMYGDVVSCKSPRFLLPLISSITKEVINIFVTKELDDLLLLTGKFLELK